MVNQHHQPRPQPGLIDLTKPGRGGYATNRRMSLAYRGPLFRVRRASDDAEQDIYPNPITGWCNVTQLVAFCTGTNGFVKTAYDLSGNGRHLTQATTTKQPKVYDSSTGAVLNGRNVCMRFDGVDDYLAYTTNSLGLSGDCSCTLSILCKFVTSSANQVLMNLGSGASNRLYPMYFGSSQAGFSDGAVALANKWRWVAPGETDEQIYTPSPAVTNFHFNVMQHGTGESSTLLVWRQNGAALTAADTTGPGWTSIDTGGFYVASITGTAGFANIEVATLAVHDTKLAGTALTNLEAQYAYMKAA